MVYPALLPLMRAPRLPVVDWTDAPADLNELVRFAERRNLVSARVPSHFKRSLLVVSVTVNRLHPFAYGKSAECWRRWHVLCIEGLRCAVDNSRTLCLIGDAARSVVRKVAQKAVGLVSQARRCRSDRHRTVLEMGLWFCRAARVGMNTL